MSAFGGAFGQPSSGFGAPASAPFGAPSAFGQNTQAAFGAAPAFGANSGGLFGASAPQQQQPSGFGAFGQSAPFGSSSVFGASAPQSAPAFGASGAFGASVFGSQPASGFAGGAFGAASQPAFGSGGGAFGSGGSLFGAARPPSGGAFGAAGSGFQQSQSAWAASSNAFGGSSSFGAPAVGGGLFGNANTASSLFGNQGNAFGGGSSSQGRGTSGANWQVTVEYDGNPGVSSKYQAISMMQQFRDKSLEELRLEDYAIGNKGGSGSGAGGNSLFAQSAPSTGLFGSSGGGGFGASSGGFGGSSAFGAQNQNQGGGFGASSGGGLFGGNSGFGNSGGFGQSSSGFGSGAGGGFGAQSGGGLFGQANNASGFGGQSGGGFASAGFGGSGFGAGAGGFGSGSGGLGSGGTGLGSGAGGFGSGGGGGFGASGSGFGSSGFGNSGFGNSGFGNSQSGGTGLFGQSGAANAFGAPQSQQNLFVAPAQSGGGLFGGGGGQAGGSTFGGGQTTANLFGGSGQNNLFGWGSATGAATAPPLFGANPEAQKPLFGASSSGFGFGGAGAGPSGMFGGGGQSVPGAGFGFGGGFGAQPNQQQNQQPSLFGNPASGQVAVNGQPAGNNPSLLNTAAAVTQGNGGTVAPPGANYGTVLHNLQKLQSELTEHKRLLQEQEKRNANNSQDKGSLSVVVLPSPPLVRLSGNRWSSSSSGFVGARGSQRTRMRSAVGRLGGATNKVSGTPLRLPSTVVKVEDALATPAAATPSERKTPLFSSQQFTGSRRPPLRSAEISTPHRSTPVPLPVPDLDEPENGVSLGAGSSTERAKTATRQLTRINGSVAKERPTSASIPRTPNGSAGKNPGAVASAQRPIDETPPPGVGGDGSASKSQLPIRKTRAESFMWSSPRPSAWSLKKPVNSVAQYDPDQYLPFQSKEGFYTVPSIAELASRTMRELQSVENFTVGREGYGEVTWIEPVDVRGLNLDDVVDIQRGEIAIYPDREASQLDAPAIVSMEGMYKRDKRTGTPSTDKELIAKYSKKLEKFCEQNKLRFLLYNSDEGRWKFEAPGFAE